jgi:hypothetical protein
MRRRSVALLLVLLVAGLGACTDDGESYDGEAGSAGDPPPAAVADEVCGTIIDWVDEISVATDELNDVVQELEVEGDSNVDEPFLTWVATVEAATDGLVEAVATLELPDTERGQALADDLAESAADARAEVDEVRADVEEELASDETLRARMGTIIVNTEKVLSLAEPSIETDGGELDQAFLDEPTCEHVTKT